MWAEYKYRTWPGLKPCNDSLQEGVVYIVSLIIEYVDVAEVVGVSSVRWMDPDMFAGDM